MKAALASKRRLQCYPWLYAATAAVALAMLLALPARSAEKALPLRPDEPVERRLEAGESHLYSLPSLGSDHRLVLNQDGIDATVLVFARDGSLLARLNAPLGRFDRESFQLPAAAARLAVEPVEGGVSAGRYSVVLEDLSTKRLEPRRTHAEALLGEAARLVLGGPNEEMQRAATLYEKAAREFALLGDVREQARALLAAANFHRVSGDAERGHELYNEALALWQRLEESGFEADCLVGLGQTARRLGHFDEAREHLEKALTLWQELGRGPESGATLTSLGLLAHLAGDFQAARKLYQTALEEHRRAGQRLEEANLLLNIGSVESQLGEAESALAHERRSLALFRQLGERRGELDTLNNLAVLHRRMGEGEEALRLYHEVRELATELGDERAEARALNNQGTALLVLGELDQATDHFERALPLRRRASDPVGEAVTLLNLGEVRYRRGQLEEARHALDAALEATRRLGHRRRVEALAKLGRLLARLGEPGGAALFAEAHELLEGRHDPLARAELLLLEGEAALMTGEPEAAAATLGKAHEIWTRLGDEAGQLLALTALGRAAREQGRLETARRHLEAAVERLESLRAELANPDLRAAFTSSRRTAHLALIDVLMDLHAREPAAGHDRAAFAVSQRSRARRLLDLLAEARLDLEDRVAPELAARRRALVRRSSLLTRRLRLVKLGRQKPAPGEDLEAILGDLETELDVVEAEIRRRDPRRAALTAAAVIDAAAVQERLDPKTTLLSYTLGDERGHLFVLTRTAFQAFTLAGRDPIEAAARRFHALLASPSATSRTAESEVGSELAALVLEPAAAALHGERLAVMADGALHYVPFTALPDTDGEGYLLERFETVSLPAIAFLEASPSSASSAPPTASSSRTAPIVHVFADPVFEWHDPRLERSRPAPADATAVARSVEGFGRLPGSRLEAEAIVAGLEPERYRLSLGLDANRDALTRLLPAAGEHSIFHFATHGVIDEERPELSGLVLSLFDAAGRRRDDGFLRLHDIYGLELGADLVVLSGCRTGLGREVRGEGLLGLTSAFFYAGARRVMASSWSVADRATAELMGHFYKALLHDGLSPAAALRAAQLALAGDRRYRDPYYWAAFTLQGDWR